MGKNQGNSFTDDIRKLQLELIAIETRLKNTGMLQTGYSALQEKREILVNQLDHLRQQQGIVAAAAIVRKSSQPKGYTESEAVKNRVNDIRQANPDKSMETIFAEVAEELGKSSEAVKASYYRKTKGK